MTQIMHNSIVRRGRPYGHCHCERCHRRKRPAIEPPNYRSPVPLGNRWAKPSGSWIYGSDKPAPTLDEVDNLQNEEAQPAQAHLKLATEEAFGLAAQELDKCTMKEIACLDSEQRGVYSPVDLPFMVFNELDNILFRSVLKGNVYVEWATLPPGMDARINRAGLHGNPRISIELSKAIATRRVMVLRMLLHQMIQ